MSPAMRFIMAGNDFDRNVTYTAAKFTVTSRRGFHGAIAERFPPSRGIASLGYT